MAYSNGLEGGGQTGEIRNARVERRDGGFEEFEGAAQGGNAVCVGGGVGGHCCCCCCCYFVVCYVCARSPSKGESDRGGSFSLEGGHDGAGVSEKKQFTMLD